MEEWRGIKDYEDFYQVSNLGKVKSLTRYKKILKPIISQDGYYRVRLSVSSKVKNMRVHRLVATAFITNPHNLPFVCHKDDDPTNNSAVNLFWGTPQDNMNDKVNKNRQSRSKGILHGKSKITERDVIEIRERISAGELYKDIANTYSVHETTISNIKTKKTWGHI